LSVRPRGEEHVRLDREVDREGEWFERLDAAHEGTRDEPARRLRAESLGERRGFASPSLGERSQFVVVRPFEAVFRFRVPDQVNDAHLRAPMLSSSSTSRAYVSSARASTSVTNFASSTSFAAASLPPTGVISQ